MITKPDTLSRKQIRQVDKLAVSELRIPSIVLMENAGKNTAGWIRSRYSGFEGAAYVVCGTGNNGGDGLVVARHLHNAGWPVRVLLVGQPDQLSEDAGINYRIVEAMGLPITSLEGGEDVGDLCAGMTRRDLIIDALFGTGFSGEVHPPFDVVIRAINSAAVKSVIAVDVPSGMDCDTGAVGNVAVEADATVTFVAAKMGLQAEAASRHVGEIVVVDIGTPPSLIDRVRT